MRKIIHIDMDCFFAAVEMRDDPALRNIPLAVGGSATRRGVISTANYLARQYGIHSAMPTAQALKLCPHLRVISGQMGKYKAVAQQIRAIFQRHTELIEPLSLDEAYLDVTHSSHCYGSATLIAEQIRRDIREELSLTASAGVAPVKFIAKIASDINKPDGLYVITPEQVAAFVSGLPLSKIPGVGKVTAQRLQELGLSTCQDVQNYYQAQLLQQFGKLGYTLWQRCHGIDDREICTDRQRKSLGVETTLNRDIHHRQECIVIIDQLYDELERRLLKSQEDKLIARQGVKLKFDDFQQTTQEHVWPELDKEDLLQIAWQVWQERRMDRGVRLIGLQVTLASPMQEKQLAFRWQE